MNDAKSSLPEGTQGPIVNDDFGRVSVATIAMTGNGYTMSEIRDVAIHLQGQINALNSVSKIVLLVVILFLGLRTALIVSAIVPLTILLSFIVMNIWVIDLQRMSIAAIIIALGLLVDNGIVIAEDMRTRMDKGEDKKQAAMSAAKSLGVPLFTSSFTTIFAFLPLMMADDVSGEYLRSLSQVIIITLLSSWFLAMFATPTLCYWLLSNEKPSNNEQNSDVRDGKIYQICRTILEKLLHFRMGFVVLMVVLLIVSVMGFAKIPKQMMPYSDRNQFLV